MNEGQNVCTTSVPYSSHPQSATHELTQQQVVVSTEQGDLYLFENMEFRCALVTPTADSASVCILAAFSKGFVTGGDNGVLRVFERSDDPREFFKCLKVTVIFSGRVCGEYSIAACLSHLTIEHPSFSRRRTIRSYSYLIHHHTNIWYSLFFPLFPLN